MPLREIQQTSRLAFLLYDRGLHPELFDIYRSQRVEKDQYDARIWVTGVSHVIGFFRGDAAVTELIADTAASLPTRGRLAAIGLRGEKEHEYAHPRGIRYLANFEVERLKPRVYERAHQDLVEQAEQQGVFVAFPQWAEGGLAPFVHISYEAKPAELHVFAYHAFPAELTLVKTQSIFELI